jgi:hypothetical protein
MTLYNPCGVAAQTVMCMFFAPIDRQGIQIFKPRTCNACTLARHFPKNCIADRDKVKVARIGSEKLDVSDGQRPSYTNVGVGDT